MRSLLISGILIAFLPAFIMGRVVEHKSSSPAFKLSDIIYWDIDEAPYVSARERAERKDETMKDFVYYKSNSSFGCPRTALPYICDNKGKLHLGICTFCFRQAQNQGLRPTMVMWETPFDKAQRKCQESFS